MHIKKTEGKQFYTKRTARQIQKLQNSETFFWIQYREKVTEKRRLTAM